MFWFKIRYAAEVQELLNWRLLSRRTSNHEACSFLPSSARFVEDVHVLLPGLGSARGRDGQHAQARKGPGTLNLHEPSESGPSTPSFCKLQSWHGEPKRQAPTFFSDDACLSRPETIVAFMEKRAEIRGNPDTPFAAAFGGDAEQQKVYECLLTS